VRMRKKYAEDYQLVAVGKDGKVKKAAS
jgi:hypothetical protein